MMNINVEGNRNARKYSTAEMRQRVVWAVVRLIFRFSPRPAFGFRRWLLRCSGAHIGTGVNIYPSARIFLPSLLSVGDWSSIGERAEIYNLGKVTIGKGTTVSQRAHLCAGTHDYLSDTFDLIRTPITIGDDVWVCADAFIGPEVIVGNSAIVAACAVVVDDVDPGIIVGGNPARKIKNRQP